MVSKTTKPKNLMYSTYRLRCSKDLWEQFKAVVPKTSTMNEALLALIYGKLGIKNPVSNVDNLQEKRK